MNITISDTVRYIKNNLRPLYSPSETDQIIYLIFEHLLNYSKIEIHINQNDIITDVISKKIEDILTGLKKHRPIQYILGNAYFYDLSFKVNEHVLIPRQETEELVRWIIDDNKEKKLNIIDIGTGTGCIAVALAKNIEKSTVFACDKSQKIIDIASENAERNNVAVNFIKKDILNEGEDNIKYDIIVSNPPYVCESEKEMMRPNVLEYEPHSALFVSDEDPLLFYRKIAMFGLKNLKKPGAIYFEINERYGNNVVDLLNLLNYSKVELRQDINRKDRMVRAIIQ